MVLAAAAFAAQAMVRVSDPLLPQIAADIGTTVGAASVVASAYATAHALSQVATGPFGDRLPKYPLIALLCAATAIGTIACGLAGSVFALALARVACGITAGMIIPLAMAFIGDAVPYERRQAVLGRFLAGQITGLVFGQAAGGVLGDHFGWRAVFFVLAGLLALASLALAAEAAGNPVTRRSARRGAAKLAPIADYRTVLSRPWPRVVIFSVLVEGALMYGAFAYVGADLHARHGLSFSAVGAVLAGYGVGGLLYVLSVQRLVNRLGQIGLAVGGGIILGVCYFGLALAPHWALSFLAVAAISFGFFMLHNTLQVNATQMAPEARATAIGLFSAALYLGQSGGVALAAPVIDRVGAPPVFIAVAVLLPILALWFAARLRRH